MKRIDVLNLIFLFTAALIVYHPVLYAVYLYTDDANLLWFAKNGIALVSVAQGRYVTYKLFEFFFGLRGTVHSVFYIRLVSLAGWMICLPLWYYIIKKVVEKNGLPDILVLLSMVYLISTPAFAITIGWASTFQLFIACTSGLLSGYALYMGIHQHVPIRVSVPAITAAVLCGLVSLFTYQSGFGCFFIPFFIQFVAVKKFTRNIYTAFGCFLLICGLYYLLFKYSLSVYSIDASSRDALATNPANKIAFFLARPLKSAFHFTWLFNEKGISGKVVYTLVVLSWLAVFFTVQKTKLLSDKLIFLGGVFVFFIFVYLPSLVVAENYASNRTLLALNFVVFVLVAETVLSFFSKKENSPGGGIVIVILLLLNAGYNFHRQFFVPVMAEYTLLKNVITAQYTGKINVVYFIRPAENTFEKKYGIVASMDEFGVPSTAKPWVPEPFIKQLIFEKTGNREATVKVLVKTWADEKSFRQSGEKITENTLLINAQQLLEQP